MGKSGWSCVWCANASKWGLQLENEMLADSPTSSVCVSACILPSRLLNVISNKLLVLRERKFRERCRLFRAQVVRALSPGCLPWMRPNRETFAFSAHVVRNVVRRSSGIVTTNLRYVVGVCVDSTCCWASILKRYCGSLGRDGGWWLFSDSSIATELLAWEGYPLLPAQLIRVFELLESGRLTELVLVFRVYQSDGWIGPAMISSEAFFLPQSLRQCFESWFLTFFWKRLHSC